MALETCAVAGAQAAIEVSLRPLRGKHWDVRTRLEAFSRARVSGA